MSMNGASTQPRQPTRRIRRPNGGSPMSIEPNGDAFT